MRNRFDEQLAQLIPLLGENDCVMITADHGCDPMYKGTDHTRENVPLLIYGKGIAPVNLGTLPTYSDIAATVCDMLGAEYHLCGESVFGRIKK